MTNQEFFDFDINIFNQPGFEGEKDYLGLLTAYMFFSMNKTQILYEDAKKIGKKPQPNSYGQWYNYSKTTLRDLFDPKSISPKNPLHRNENDFIDKYESLCKTFLKAYEIQYPEMYDKSSEYYAAKSITDSFCEAIAYKTSSNSKKEKYARTEQISSAGFVDLRFVFKYSLSYDKIIPLSYDDNMIDDYYNLFSNSLNSFIRKYNNISIK